MATAKRLIYRHNDLKTFIRARNSVSQVRKALPALLDDFVPDAVYFPLQVG